MKRRAFISMLTGAAGTLILPKWRIPDPTIILPEAPSVIAAGLGYIITEEAVSDNLYSFGLATTKPEGGVILYDSFRKILLPGLKKAWSDRYNDPEFEDLFK